MNQVCKDLKLVANQNIAFVSAAEEYFNRQKLHIQIIKPIKIHYNLNDNVKLVYSISLKASIGCLSIVP